jgi:hypothetical protein
MDELDLYFEQIWEKHKHSKKLPVEFEKNLKQSFMSAAREVWKKSLEHDRERMIREFPDFVKERYFHTGPVA